MTKVEIKCVSKEFIRSVKLEMKAKSDRMAKYFLMIKNREK